jgi:hypothetical protein
MFMDDLDSIWEYNVEVVGILKIRIHISEDVDFGWGGWFSTS